MPSNGNREKLPADRVVMVDLGGMMEQIVRDALTDERSMKLEQRVVSSLYALQKRSLERAVVVIKTDARGFAKACEELSDVPLVGIAPDWHQLMMRFTDVPEERVRDAILFVAGVSQQVAFESDELSSQDVNELSQRATPASSEPASQDSREVPASERASSHESRKEPAKDPASLQDVVEALVRGMSDWFPRKPQTSEQPRDTNEKATPQQRESASSPGSTKMPIPEPAPPSESTKPPAREPASEAPKQPARPPNVWFRGRKPASK